MSKGKLHKYQSNRKKGITPEPFKSGRKNWHGRIFVIQKHAASNLHYDLRLEIDGALKSWAVPKGPSLNPKDRRLAVETEDHPLSYKDFEGVIPEEEYGGGTVMVWDAGPYENIKTKKDSHRPMAMIDAYKQGTIEVELKGQKLQGKYALFRTKLGGKKKNWMLVKMKDDYADARRNPVSTENKSVLSGRTMNQIERDAESDEGE